MRVFSNEQFETKRCSWICAANNIFPRCIQRSSRCGALTTTYASRRNDSDQQTPDDNYGLRRFETPSIAPQWSGSPLTVASSPSKPAPALDSDASSTTYDGLKFFESGRFLEAKLKYKAAAMRGDFVGLHNLGTMYLHGQGIDKDYTKAYGCFKRCSDHGIIQSMSQLGYMYLHGRGVPKNAEKARAWFTRSAQEGGTDAYALFHLGMMYILGTGVAKDVVHGCEWLERSADKEFAPALYNLAVLYMDGRDGIPQNVSLATTFLKRAAKLQDPYAQNNLGTLYASGVVVKRNLRKAFSLFLAAAKQGVSAALFNLGEMYNNGLGVPQEITTAAKYYLKAATKAINAEAEFNLACLFLTGKGPVGQDLDLALHWFEKAALHGHKGARNNAQVLLSPHFNDTPPVLKTADATQRVSKSILIGSEARKRKSSRSKKSSFIRFST